LWGRPLVIHCPQDEGTRDVTSQDFIKFWGNFFFAFDLLALIENSQGFKIFELYKRYILKTISKLPIIFGRTSLRKPNTKIFLLPPLYSNLCKPACKGMNLRGIYKDCISKAMIENIPNYYFINY
jgi:hypothetical protein